MNLDVLAAEAARRGHASPALDRAAVQTLLHDAAVGAQQLGAILKQLAGNRDGLCNHPVTEQFLARAFERLAWIASAETAGYSYVALAAGTSGQASVALLGMAAARAHAAHVGLAILRPWFAFLQLHDRVAMLPLLQLEHRYRVLEREQRGVDALFARVARFDPADLAAASADTPGRVAALATAFDETLAEVDHAEKLQRRVMQLQMVAELVAFAGSLRGMFALRGPPTAMALPMPVLAGAGGGGAVMSQVVVSAEWLAALKHLVEIGAITAAGAAEALRVRGVSSAMAQASDLPQSVKDLLGKGPTTDAMKVTNSTGAGVARPPRHHVLPQEERAFFEQSGFTGDLDIDNFTVEMEVAEHQAQHGGGNWRTGRMWPGEWNQLVMQRLRDTATQAGRRLTVQEIMKVVER